MKKTKSIAQVTREQDMTCNVPFCDNKRTIQSGTGGVFCDIHYGANPDKPYSGYKVVVDYCENNDGRLGFICDATLHAPYMLTVDHIDGNHKNDELNNFQSLCQNCHSYKTMMCKDYLPRPINEARVPLYANYQYPWIDTKHPCPF